MRHSISCDVIYISASKYNLKRYNVRIGGLIFDRNYQLKGLRHDLSRNFSKFIYPFLTSRMANMNVLNVLPKFESQILRYK